MRMWLFFSRLSLFLFCLPLLSVASIAYTGRLLPMQSAPTTEICAGTVARLYCCAGPCVPHSCACPCGSYGLIRSSTTDYCKVRSIWLQDLPSQMQKAEASQDYQS
ncbi:hypothetical protein GGR51DRAFT_493919 [Nemania sp. FL0031]|nr:hypothetical protein GGR51DRAFT_493919 [Nemania sp. FL0031]